MTEPFKEFFNKKVVGWTASHLKRSYPAFDEEGFVQASCKDFPALELKQRSNAIRDTLVDYLPEDFQTATDILVNSLAPEDRDESVNFGSASEGVHGWMIQPMADFLALRGLDHPEVAMPALAEMTKRFTAEFAVRPFLDADPDGAMAWFQNWAVDPNMHVRRLASEGCRPRLPWGMKLHAFVADPSPLLPVLTTLRDDPEEYVRRSVANNLNDIAKDHPDLVAKVAKDWMKGASNDRQRLVKHACRSLIKDGHVGALDALGYGPASVELEEFKVATPKLYFGEALSFEATIVSTAAHSQDLIVDFVVHHVKADGSRTPKVFKLKIATIGAGKTLKISKRHPIKPITTRVYYGGQHRVELQVNGAVLGGAEFDLIMPPT